MTVYGSNSSEKRSTVKFTNVEVQVEVGVLLGYKELHNIKHYK